MRVTPRRSFPFSRDGITAEQAVAGADCDVPDALVPGLMDAGYLEVKAIIAAPENKMMPPLENKTRSDEDWDGGDDLKPKPKARK